MTEHDHFDQNDHSPIYQVGKDFDPDWNFYKIKRWHFIRHEATGDRRKPYMQQTDYFSALLQSYSSIIIQLFGVKRS